MHLTTDYTDYFYVVRDGNSDYVSVVTGCSNLLYTNGTHIIINLFDKLSVFLPETLND